MALEEVVRQCRERKVGGDFDNDCFLISKLTNIEAGVENIRKRLDQRGIEDKRDLHAAFRCTLRIISSLEDFSIHNDNIQTGVGRAGDGGKWGGVDLLGQQAQGGEGG